MAQSAVLVSASFAVPGTPRCVTMVTRFNGSVHWKLPLVYGEGQWTAEQANGGHPILPAKCC